MGESVAGQIEVESKLAYLERTVTDLSAMVYAQGKELDELRSLVGHLKEKLLATPGLVDATVTELPPHY